MTEPSTQWWGKLRKTDTGLDFHYTRHVKTSCWFVLSFRQDKL